MSSSHHLQCVSLLKRCKYLVHLKQVHALAAKIGTDADSLFAGKVILLASVTVVDAIEYACRLLATFPSPDAFMFNTIIRGLAESDQPNRSLLTYAQMKGRSLSPDSFSFAFLLKAAANFKSLSAGIQLHSHAIHHGLDAHLFVGTTMVSMYAECGCIASAEKAFDQLPQPNVVAWNAMVTAYFCCGEAPNARKVFAQMPLRNLTSWNLMLAGYTKMGELGEARMLFSEMELKDQVSWSTMIAGFASHGHFEEALGFFRKLIMTQGILWWSNEVSLTAVLSACAQRGAFESGKILHGLIQKTGLNSIVAVGNALLDMYARCGHIAMAQRVFSREMCNKNIVSWTSMIAALAMQGRGEESLVFFNEMVESGIRPDWISLVAVLYACSHSGLVQQGCELFQRMENDYGVQPSVEHYGCVVDLYGRAGLLEKAYDFVTQMPMKPNAIIWRTLLGACSIHGNVELAEGVRMKLAELEPNDSSDCVLLSNVYAMARKWSNVAEVRNSMNEKSMRKDPGWSSVEVNKVVYSFVASDKLSSVREEAIEKLEEIMLKLRMEGYKPQVSNVLHDIEEEEKEDAIVRHSEKLAVAFSIGRMRVEDQVITIVKNLRVCRDCHEVMKLISKAYNRIILLRDRSRFHNFKEGSCSCRDYW
ncbi:Pentatricopeptide repeat-containing protein [Apostasia shenzhenica]|uniref:Pentatricopeptide repeat-containing protein n=1 Tax=Apostasia shenzhenica TaxID=1088818 RepID=A0A2H9ZQW9_9ASPA|nr:Pentatricopeptide repeat-containing protein [Apostasia shenzhenica]